MLRLSAVTLAACGFLMASDAMAEAQGSDGGTGRSGTSRSGYHYQGHGDTFRAHAQKPRQAIRSPHQQKLSMARIRITMPTSSVTRPPAPISQISGRLTRIAARPRAARLAIPPVTGGSRRAATEPAGRSAPDSRLPCL
ncbi:hypothetical protein [Sorlinia euscelidii]|uniref:Uncharacterized protein n=1 Tax=Sorlinia euscelidii TaxID=3081148 RepID=A0ABU7U631_9PROT